MRRRRLLRRLRVVLLGLIAIAAGGLAIAAYETGFFQRIELATVDARFAVRGSEKPPGDIVVVGVDDRTFDELHLRWPFARTLHAQVIDRLRSAGARVIAYDVQFTEPSPGRLRYCPYVGADAAPADCALVTATGKAGNLVFATTEVDPRGHTNVLGGDQVLRALHASAGNGIVPDDADGKDRRVPSSVDRLKSFAVVTVERATGRVVHPNEFTKDGTGWIDFRGPPGTIPEIPMSRVLSGRFSPGYFRGKIVVVGAVAPTLKDVFHTSVGGGELMSGAELQANAIDTVRRGLPLRDPSSGVDLLLIVLLAAVVPLGSARLSPMRALGTGLVLAAAFLVGAQIAFDHGRVVTVVYPLVALILSAVGALVLHYFTETRERRRTRMIFSRFVPEDVVDEVLDRTDEDLRLGGVEVECTIMFSDLRGFTTFSESMPVDRVIDALNRYLGEMSTAILDHGGTLVSYMGDGIMAVFGAPIEEEDHADRALAAAREMAGPHLARFNAYLREEGLPEFRMGIGLNTGTVMAGNVGSERRLEYTVIGDVTNTASRIEGLTKGTPHQILLAESTHAALRHTNSDLVYVDDFPIRGRTGKIRLWSIQDHAPEPGRAAEPDATTSP